MACVRPHCLRHLTTHPICLHRGLQRRWARVHDVRFVATHQSQDRIIDRYKEKLQEKVRKEGLKDLGQLKKVYSHKINQLRKQAIVPGATGPLHASTNGQDPVHVSTESPWPAPPSPPLQSSKTTKYPGLKTLSSFIDVEKTMSLPKREIESIWRLRHAHNEHSICAAIPVETFSFIASTARRHPQFILPGLPRKQSDDQSSGNSATPGGAHIHFLQWTFPAPDTITVLFTHLAEYKLRGEYAQPHTTLTHHLELALPTGLVLCQGTIVPDRGVSVEEGKWLVMCMQKFYNTKTVQEIDAEESQNEVVKELKKSRRRLIEQFSHGDNNFKIEELLDQAERLG